MKKIIFAMVLLSMLGLTTGCSSGPLSAEDLAARETESNASQWDEEDYKTIAAKSCLKYKEVFNKSLREWYANWSIQGTEYTLLGLTSGALDEHPKWNPIAKNINELKYNAINRASGGSGVAVSTDVAIQAFDLCNELGVDVNN
jgi:hypothetical protein